MIDGPRQVADLVDHHGVADHGSIRATSVPGVVVGFLVGVRPAGGRSDSAFSPGGSRAAEGNTTLGASSPTATWTAWRRVQDARPGAGTAVTITNTYSLDPAGRIDTITTTTDRTETQRLQYRFSGESDAPTSLADLHGDTAATQTTATGATTLASYSETDEYGAPQSASPLAGTATSVPTNAAATPSADSPSWAQGCITRFSGTNDTILGGGATKYAYPVAPVSPWT